MWLGSWPAYARERQARMEAVKLPSLATIRKGLRRSPRYHLRGRPRRAFLSLHFGANPILRYLFRLGPLDRDHPKSVARPLRLADKRPATITCRSFAELFRRPPIQTSLNGLEPRPRSLNWTAGVLNRVDRAAFLQGLQEHEAVQYFYEPFLEAFDPELRKQLGVWYTPPEIVKYMVARVDTRPARGPGPTRWPGRSGRVHPRSLLWHRGVFGRSAADHRHNAQRQG